MFGDDSCSCFLISFFKTIPAKQDRINYTELELQPLTFVMGERTEGGITEPGRCCANRAAPSFRFQQQVFVEMTETATGVLSTWSKVPPSDPLTLD